MIIIHLQICLLFYSHKKCTNLICDVPLNLTQSNKKRGFSGEREGEGRRGGRGREGEEEERGNDFSCFYRFSSSSFKETVKRGQGRSLTLSYTPQQDKR